MGKQGPCCHCGVASTPLWRNGPPDKPVLCNACGSRWRTKGSLTNYAPLHARAEPDDFVDPKEPRIKIAYGKYKEAGSLKRKRTYENAVNGSIASIYNDSFWKAMDDDASNRSSSGSAGSNFESYAYFGTTYDNKLTGPSRSVLVDRMKPAKRRTCIPRPKPSSIATLTKDLCTILHQQQSSRFSEEDLLFESDRSMFSGETGHGSYLIRDTSSLTREEDSEATSFSADNKSILGSETCSSPKGLLVHTSSKSVKFQTERHEEAERNTVQSGMSEILGSQGFPLTTINLKDVLNHEEFLRHLTDKEQEQLLRCLPCVDDSSLRSLFDGSHFVDSFSTFHRLITEGVSNASLPGVRSDDRSTFDRLALCNLIKSKSVELFNVMKV
uniref:GATA-type domain-containing protein n=1 Tax=Kalanchoe fedtschenkoi TaxID=63787 RepID=A0A7N0VGP8_KALFE